jgi:hypothetical protein
VVELDRPKRAPRRHGAKSDPLDAIRAAQEALSRTRLGPHAAVGNARPFRCCWQLAAPRSTPRSRHNSKCISDMRGCVLPRLAARASSVTDPVTTLAVSEGQVGGSGVVPNGQRVAHSFGDEVAGRSPATSAAAAKPSARSRSVGRTGMEFKAVGAPGPAGPKRSPSQARTPMAPGRNTPLTGLLPGRRLGAGLPEGVERRRWA